MSTPPATHQIHSLPVVVNYNLPGSSQTFTTLLPSTQQVYVHPNSAASTSDDGQNEICGSIYLKTIVQGVITASPEIHPLHPSMTDLTLYIFDPRETSLRRSRTSLPQHIRSSFASSPLSAPSSPAPVQNLTSQEVWTGKGLVSWALDEPGLGKQLVTGRLIESSIFASVPSGELTGLEALMAANQGESWGIEINLTLKSGDMKPVPTPLQSGYLMTRDARSSTSIAEVTVSATPKVSTTGQTPTTASPKREVSHTRPLSPSQRVNITPAATSSRVQPKKGSTGKKRKAEPKSQPVQPPAQTQAKRPSIAALPSARLNKALSSDGESFPGDIPAQLYSNPESLTKEQAERLLESPAFLNMLSNLTGRPIEPAEAGPSRKIRGSKKRAREEAEKVPEKKPKAEEKAAEDGESSNPVHKCWNCGRTKSAVWRTKVMEDGKAVRVCNACGLYWNKLRVMRPPALWQGVDEEPRTMKKDKADQPASRIDLSKNNSGGLKRTLSSAVNQDAKRLAELKSRSKSLLTKPARVIPASSPVRPAQQRTQPSQSVRNGHWTQDGNIAASSPGGWTQPMHPPQVPSEMDDFNPVSEPHAGPSNHATSSQIPQSDVTVTGGQELGSTSQVDWGTDLSAFFDLDGFSLPAQGSEIDQTAHPTSEQVEGDSDDVVSQLFNRTSSVALQSSSPVNSQPFDWSTLPPSSPPVMPSDLPHSALLLSSPDLSPFDRRPSPVKTGFGSAKSTYTPLPTIDEKPTPPVQGSATKQQQVQHNSAGDGVDVDAMWNGQFDNKAFEEFFGKIIDEHNQSQSQGDGQPGELSSAGETERMIGEDFLAMLEKNIA